MPASIVSVKPVLLPAPERGEDLQVRVSAPLLGTGLPVLVLSHGYGWSLDGYAPLADHWAAHGFVVLQPTHLDSRTLGIPADDPRTPRIWRFRIEDVARVLDSLDALVAAVPGLPGRVDPSRIAVAGHSWGGQTVGTLLGARVLGEDFSDPRVKAGVLLATAGLGDDLTPFAAEQLPFMRPSFATMTPPVLVVAGDRDQSHLSTRGPDWFTDPYVHSPGPKGLLTVFGGEHSLGGIVGHEVAETTDESPARVAMIQRVSTGFLRGALGVSGEMWAEGPGELGKLEWK
ncbi:alpha/beta hydrolase family protein [Streptomyces acidiscabies]|uniref:alpha/beta hydrolase family protein n=1 Tax=Streptomyces acidiscabies TaxID=42234 RepID=UPI00067C5CC0|nr:dienelactone hydrolase family protein [Streptomyces acidiscabies]